MHNAKPAYTFYETFAYRNTTKMFRKTSWITMHVAVFMCKGKKVYRRTRVRTAVLTQCPQTRETLWKYSINSALAIRVGDHLDY